MGASVGAVAAEQRILRTGRAGNALCEPEGSARRDDVSFWLRTVVRGPDRARATAPIEARGISPWFFRFARGARDSFDAQV